MAYRSIKGKKSKIKAWSLQKMTDFAEAGAVKITGRTFSKGQGLDDRRHRRYKGRRPSSRVPIYKQKGIKYGAYSYRYGKKREARNLPTNRITLIFGGKVGEDLQSSISLFQRSRFSAKIGPKGNAAKYAGFVHADRPFLGFSPRDRKFMKRQFRRIWRKRK